MEDLGLSDTGRAVHDVLDGRYDRDGAIPCQPDGGLKCFGHPVGASGLRMAYEVYTQLLGRAGERQIGSPALGLTHNLGGIPNRNVASVVRVRAAQELTMDRRVRRLKPTSTPRDWGFTDEQLATHPIAFRADLLAGKVFLVSGGGSGMGRGMAYALARLGADVMICGRRKEKLEETADGIRRHLDRNIATRAMTIRDPEQVDALVAETWERFGRLDLVVNNGGGQFPQTGDRLQRQGLAGRHRHESERHLVHDAVGRTPVARSRLSPGTSSTSWRTSGAACRRWRTPVPRARASST